MLLLPHSGCRCCCRRCCCRRCCCRRCCCRRRRCCCLPSFANPPRHVPRQDPPRVEVQDAIEQCRAAGIRVIMVTGERRGGAGVLASRAGCTGWATGWLACAQHGVYECQLTVGSGWHGWPCMCKRLSYMPSCAMLLIACWVRPRLVAVLPFPAPPTSAKDVRLTAGVHTPYLLHFMCGMPLVAAGDNKSTAESVGRQVGLLQGGQLSSPGPGSGVPGSSSSSLSGGWLGGWLGSGHTLAHRCCPMDLLYFHAGMEFDEHMPVHRVFKFHPSPFFLSS